MQYCGRLDHHSDSRGQELSKGSMRPDALFKDEMLRISPLLLEPRSDESSLGLKQQARSEQVLLCSAAMRTSAAFRNRFPRPFSLGVSRAWERFY